jgi:DNA-binding NarL/FixJ family response regulator
MRILVVEDQELFREMLVKACRESGYTVVGQAADGETALGLISSLNPSLLLLDIELPKLDGFAVIDKIHANQAQKHIKILVLSSICSIYAVYRLERAHVNGFIDKNTEALSSVKAALQRVAAGGTFFSESFHAAKRDRDTIGHSFHLVLSSRQLQVLGLMAQNKTDEQIGQVMGITCDMVEKHRFQIKARIGKMTRVEMVRWATDVGIKVKEMEDEPSEAP